MTNLERVLKSKHHIANKGLYSKSYGFSSSHVHMQELDHKESWTFDTFELWCWRRLLRVPWTASRSNQSILKEISPEYLFEGLMLKLKLLWPPDSKNCLIWKWCSLMLGKIEGGRRRGRQRMRWLDGITDSMNMSLGGPNSCSGWTPAIGDGQGGLACCSPWGCKELDMTERLNWKLIADF